MEGGRGVSCEYEPQGLLDGIVLGILVNTHGKTFVVCAWRCQNSNRLTK